MSPDPWNVRATRPPAVGPWATKAAGPAGPVVGAGTGTGTGEGRSDVGAGDAFRAGDEQAPSTAAEAAPRNVRRLIATPHSGSGAQAVIVTKLNRRKLELRAAPVGDGGAAGFDVGGVVLPGAEPLALKR